MLFTKIAAASALSSVAYAAAAAGGTGLALDQSAVQIGSTVDGSKQVGAAEVGQALSLTSNNNFINNCVGKTLTNGLQQVGGSCNGITMGDIPAKDKMVSSIIINPPTSAKAFANANEDFAITVQMINIVAGSFTNADATYYAAPQFLQGGVIVGHTHVTVQDLGQNLNPQTPPDPTVFAFFKGINDDGNGKGLLTANVTGGLPAGNYRVCTLAGASNHQPVLMPVAQRGGENDCTKFVIGGNGGTANAASNNGANGVAAAALVQSAVDAGPGAVDPNLGKTAAAAAATSSAAAAGGKGGKGGAAAGGGKAASTTAAAAAATSSAAAAGGKGGKGGAAAAAGGGKAASATTAAAAVNTGAAGGKAGVAGGQAGQAAGGKGFGGKAAAGGKGRKQRARRERQFIA